MSLKGRPYHRSILGLVLFLEEDHYVSDDFLTVLQMVEAERTTRYPNCDIICLGTYLKSYNYNRDHKTVSLEGMAAASYKCKQATVSFLLYNKLVYYISKR